MRNCLVNDEASRCSGSLRFDFFDNGLCCLCWSKRDWFHCLCCNTCLTHRPQLFQEFFALCFLIHAALRARCFSAQGAQWCLVTAGRPHWRHFPACAWASAHRFWRVILRRRLRVLQFQNLRKHGKGPRGGIYRPPKSPLQDRRNLGMFRRSHDRPRSSAGCFWKLRFHRSWLIWCCFLLPDASDGFRRHPITYSGCHPLGDLSANSAGLADVGAVGLLFLNRPTVTIKKNHVHFMLNQLHVAHISLFG